MYPAFFKKFSLGVMYPTSKKGATPHVTIREGHEEVKFFLENNSCYIYRFL